MTEIKHYGLKNILTKLNYLKNIINNLKKSDKWKIHLKIATNFISSKDFDKEHVTYFKREK